MEPQDHDEFDTEDIYLPNDIFDTDLTLAEIATLAFFVAAANGRHHLDHPRMLAEGSELVVASKRLRERGIIEFKVEPGMEGKSVKVTIGVCFDKLVAKPSS